MNPKQPEELHELCERLVEQQLTPDQSARLEVLVRESATARRYVVEHLQLHAGLHWESGRIGQQTLPDQLAASLAGLESPTESKVVPLPSPWKKNAVWLAAAASIAVLATGIGLGISLAKHEHPAPQAAIVTPPVVATLTQTRGCRWESSALPTAEGARLTAGKLSLTYGLATLRFESGATITLEAPAVLEIVNKDLCILHRGMLTAHVPKQAVGFTVETANAKIIDHGTEFGISAGADGKAHVQVFDGEVEVRHRQSGENLRLTTGENAVLNRQAVAARNTSFVEADRATRENTAANQPAGTVTLTTASGRGRTSYVFSQGTENHHSDSLMLVKNTHTPGYRRKAYFSFDLSTIKGQKVENAALALTFEPTGYGFASRLPTCVFTVYGLKDGAQDEWSEHEIIWDNAPANRNGGNEIDSAAAVPLGTFSIEPEETSGLRVISTPALTEFINSDHNGQATLIIVRETSETVLKGLASGLVHGFAGNYHPTAPPPTLRLNMAAR
ncbi:MAG TPA: DNRLRE domain-containing protein [Verrucomicrobiae bacterium]